MSLINVQNLTFGYYGASKNVFENVSFAIDTDWKTGFVGRNGRGKTTFLDLLTGKYEYSGKISASVKFTYFPFALKDESGLVQDVLGQVCPMAEEWEIIREFSYLDLSPEIPYREYASLSSGEKTKALLAGLFLNDGEFLLIDEPTNHLDSAARKTVAEYLRGKKSFLLVSHDRAFLDGCVDHILSVNRSNIEVQSGNFSSWYENFERQQAYESAQNERLKKDIARLGEAAKRAAAWSDKTERTKYGKNDSGLKPDRGYVGHKSAKMMKRAKSAEARAQKGMEQKAGLLKNAETAQKLKLGPLEYRAERVLGLYGVEIAYGNVKACGPVDFELLRGERVALCGKNGCGKSSLLKLVIGADVPHTGTFALSSGVKISYVPQTHESVFGKISDFAQTHGIDESLFRAVLDKMGFSVADCGEELAACSPGQKKKLLIAKSLCEKAHLYIWDEPLNYLDIYARMQIEELILEFCPTMIFVEHDEAFVRAAATRRITL